MAYQFLETEDFEAAILKQLLVERDQENVTDILEAKEAIAIAMVKAKLNGRYDTTAIFDADGTDRHYLIIHYVVTIAIYLFVKRNAARKVPKDYKDDYDSVMKDLERILAGKLTPDGLTKPADGDGEPVKRVIYGNRKNTDYYI